MAAGLACNVFSREAKASKSARPESRGSSARPPAPQRQTPRIHFALTTGTSLMASTAHRAQQRLRRYYESVRRRVPRRYSLPCGSTAWQAPSHHPPTRERQCRNAPSHVPCRSSRPDSRRLHAGHHLANQRSPARLIPGVPTAARFRCHLLSYDTSTAIPENEDCAPSFRSPPDASRAPFPHRSPRRSSANAACGGLKPPTAGRLRRAKPSSPAQHHVKKFYLHRTPLHARGTRRVSMNMAKSQ
jgi:hypothetical protein